MCEGSRLCIAESVEQGAFVHWFGKIQACVIEQQHTASIKQLSSSVFRTIFP